MINVMHFSSLWVFLSRASYRISLELLCTFCVLQTFFIRNEIILIILAEHGGLGRRKKKVIKIE